jgi:diacylglycerol kinase (ATP)
MPLRRIALVVNPHSRGVRRAAIEATAAFLAQHIDTSLVWTTGPGDATIQAARLGADPDTLVTACGGDGTVFEVLNGLPPQGVLGLLPAGTANVIARELGIPLAWREAAKALLTGAVRTFDTGRWNDRRFFMVAGCEFDAHVAAAVPRLPKRWLGQYAYHLETLRRYPTYAPPRLRVEIDGQTTVEGAFVLFANLRRYGGGLFFAQGARPDDGRLDLVALRRLSLPFLVKGLWGAWTRRGVGSDIAHRCQGRSFLLRSSRPVRVQLDGEVLEPVTEARITVEPASLRLVAP